MGEKEKMLAISIFFLSVFSSDILAMLWKTMDFLRESQNFAP